MEQNNEFSVQLNAHQLELFKAARTEYAKNMNDIANIKEYVKGDVEALIDGLGWDKKEDKQQIKALKLALRLYVKQQANEHRNLADEAATLANI